MTFVNSGAFSLRTLCRSVKHLVMQVVAFMLLLPPSAYDDRFSQLCPRPVSNDCTSQQDFEDVGHTQRNAAEPTQPGTPHFGDGRISLSAFSNANHDMPLRLGQYAPCGTSPNFAVPARQTGNSRLESSPRSSLPHGAVRLSGYCKRLRRGHRPTHLKQREDGVAHSAADLWGRKVHRKEGSVEQSA